MTTIFYALVAVAVIYSTWKLTIFLLGKFRTVTECPGCEGKGWYMGVREKEICEICKGTGKKQ